MNLTVVGQHRRAIDSESAQMYERAHQQMPQAVLDALLQAGIKRWIIFRDGCNLFHFIECEDYPSAMKQFRADSAGRQWQAEMAQLLESIESDSDRMSPPLKCIWSFKV